MTSLVLTAILATVCPTALYFWLIWWLDRYEKEPLLLLAAAFVWGSVPAIMLAILFQVVLAVPLSNSPLGPDITTWALAPLVEEPVKALALVALFVFVRREFDGPIDGIVYGALIGFGFAMTENVLFFLYNPDNLSGLFWLRSVVFGFNHALFTSIVGLGLGLVRYARQRWSGYVVVPASLLLAIMVHSLHNIIVQYQWLGLAVAWAVQSSGLLIMVIIVVLAWHRERTWLKQELGEELHLGIISTSNYVETISLPHRTRAQVQALCKQGLRQYVRVRQLHHLVTELAFCKYQLRIGDRFQCYTERERLRQEIISLRALLREPDRPGHPFSLPGGQVRPSGPEEASYE